MHPPRFVLLCVVSVLWASVAEPGAAAPADGCGAVISIETHNRTTTRYAFAHAGDATGQGPRTALVLLVGGGGHVDLDDQGCPRALTGNPLVRMLPLFHDAGFATALVDAPSDHPGEDGLAGFRMAGQHADDVGKVIADMRARAGGPVWLLGHSRGTISAANVAARLSGPSAPDGVVLLSAMMVGNAGGRKTWVAQTVFDPTLEAIKAPTLVLGHVADNCIRSPAGQMGNVAARIHGARHQAVAVTGGPAKPGGMASIADCGARQPHGFIDQEAEIVAGIGRFIRGDSY